MSKHVTYCRASTVRLGQSGLGLEAQLAVALHFVPADVTKVAEYI
jgi:hypothetical protein